MGGFTDFLLKRGNLGKVSGILQTFTTSRPNKDVCTYRLVQLGERLPHVKWVVCDRIGEELSVPMVMYRTNGTLIKTCHHFTWFDIVFFFCPPPTLLYTTQVEQDMSLCIWYVLKCVSNYFKLKLKNRRNIFTWKMRNIFTWKMTDSFTMLCFDLKLTVQERY